MPIFLLASLQKAHTTLSTVSRSLKFILLLMPLSLLGACSLLSQETNGMQDKISARVMPLLPVPDEFQQKIWLEKFTFLLHGQGNEVNSYAKQSMLLQTELTDEGINIAAMSFDGIPLAQASWKKGSQVVKSELTAAKNFDAQQVLHDLQIVNWPINIIAPALARRFSVDEQIITDVSTGSKNKVRRFYHQGEVIIIIHYQEKTISLEQLNLGYQLTITRLNDSYLKIAEEQEPSNK